jgi:type II secretory ATPase GspE/PulE/Tfp pilus assembly ATPase PilB-like protein
VYRGASCDACLDSGCHGRIGIFELLTVSEPIRELILAQAKASSLKAEALHSGMTTLRADGLAKVASGVTTMDEVVRVTGRDEF